MKLFIRYCSSFDQYMLPFIPDSHSQGSTPFTRLSSQSDVEERLLEPDLSLSSLRSPLPVLRSDRPVLLVTSTSWTPDEDFGLLLDTLHLYEKRAREVNVPGRTTYNPNKPLPKIVMVVTGKGPLRERYMWKADYLLTHENWQWARCVDVWLEPEDYPTLLGSCFF